MDGPFFSLAPYHLLLAGCGLVIVAAYWLPRFVSGHEPAASGLLILGGLALFGLVPGMPAAISPIDRPALWEVAAEFAVIVALFGTGIRIDRVRGKGLWTPTVRMLAVAMPLCIAGVALMGLAAGLTLAGAVLLAAVLAPTDPVLAAEVQVGPPLEGGEHPVRFALTAEAGLNDGLAFPFVYLALFLATTAGGALDWLGEWIAVYVVYKIAVGALAGAAAGWLLGRILFRLPATNPLALTGSGVVALAGVIVTYGLTELVEGYGFIAAFAMGVCLRRAEAKHEFHARLHDFSEALEQAVTAILLVMLGAALPALWPYLEWRHVALAAGLVFVVRPLSGMLALAGTALSPGDRARVAFFGVRGLGSIYYLAYAGGMVALTNEGALWATVAATILLSTLVHGFSAGAFVTAATEDRATPRRS